jgi:ApeA-like protein
MRTIDWLELFVGLATCCAAWLCVLAMKARRKHGEVAVDRAEFQRPGEPMSVHREADLGGITSTLWWQPTKPDEKLPGVLFKDEEDGWMLQLDGNFVSFDVRAASRGGKPVPIPNPPEGFPVVVGITSQGQMVSLMKCHTRKSSIPFGGSRGSLTLWPPRWCMACTSIARTIFVLRHFRSDIHIWIWTGPHIWVII